MSPILSVSAVTNTYKSGQVALRETDLQVEKGEIFALLGPNGAGKTTLISIICGIVSMTSGRSSSTATTSARYRAARAKIGLVPQEIALDIFATVATRCASAGACSARAPTRPYRELLRDLSLWDKRNSAGHRALRRNEAAGDDRQGAEP